MVDLLDRINVMLEQESNSYMTVDYLAPEFQQKLTTLSGDLGLTPSTSSSSTSSSSSSTGINEVWREKICEWSYQVIDHFDFSREVVSISIHYLDRYLATRTVTKKQFQLIAMTALFLAIKLYEPGRLSMVSMIELSRGYFMVEQMAEMETSILRALNWRVHPPTAYCFAKHFLFLLPYNVVSLDERHSILELARFFTELGVIDYFFVVHQPSFAGLAAILNALDEIPSAARAIPEFKNALAKVGAFDYDHPSVLLCRQRLGLLYAQGGYSRPASMENGSRTETVSPVCVSYGVTVRSSLESQSDPKRY